MSEPFTANRGPTESTGSAFDGRAWLRFWFEPADAEPLAVVRILTGILGLVLTGSYAGDLQIWFGPAGMMPPADGGAGRMIPSVFALADSPGALRLTFELLRLALLAVTVGFFARTSCLAAALLWASLLARGPALVGPADDCLAVLLWCLAVGPSGGRWSVDQLIRRRRTSRTVPASSWARVSLGLLRIHVTAITVAMLLAQMKGDAWWDGTAAWWLTARTDSRLLDLTTIYRRSEYLMNLVTHAIVTFEALFAVGLWSDATRRHAAGAGLVAWPVIGLLAGEPWWGVAMAIFCVPDAFRWRGAGYTSTVER